MPEVTVTGFKRADHALEALATEEYRALLVETGCPTDQIDNEVETFRQQRRRASTFLE